jgi:hypothetical protein
MNAPTALREHPRFAADFERLRAVTLNPARHTAPNAHAHSLWVASRARELATLHHCTPGEAGTLEALGLVHDIGKIHGTTAPAKSVELLPDYGIDDPRFIDLVRYHDVNLPWHIATTRGEPPTDKAWRKLASRVDVFLLSVFMLADRVDCPGGVHANLPLVWFLDEAARRGLLTRPLHPDAW